MAGIFVAAVKEGSPAYNSGLRRGDQILMVSNQTSSFASNTHGLIFVEFEAQVFTAFFNKNNAQDGEKKFLTHGWEYG